MVENATGAKEKAGFQAARNITRRWAKTFYTASLLLPGEKRNASYALYAICRLSDESVDAQDATQAEMRLREIENNIRLAYENDGLLANPLLCAFKITVCRYAIPKSCFEELIAGMRMDLAKNRYATFKELYDYCYKVAGVVGLLMVQIFGFADQRAKTHAVELGIAMQLTNILRDIQEDYARGRIYLPQDEMDSFGISQAHLAEKTVDAPMQKFLRFQITRARDYYRRAQEGIRYIDNRNSRLVILAMATMYAGILDTIEAYGRDVFLKRARLSGAQKAVYLCAMLLKGRYL